MPVLLLFCAWAAPNALGLARSALTGFSERSHRRGITYTDPTTNLEIYGRVLSGLDPGTPFIQARSRKRRSRVSGQVLITSSPVSQPRCAVPTP